MEITANVKNYEWGRRGPDSVVAKLVALNSEDFEVDKDTPYAELWMGDHPSGPSSVKATKQKLNANLPFLFKVLSIRKALSIQVHPNKSEAERLHKERPDIYKDPNHKPELAIALSPFLALCGFRPYQEIYNFCQEMPPLKALVGGDNAVEALKGGTRAALRNCYEKLMTSGEEETVTCIEDITKNYIHVVRSHRLEEVYKTIYRDFPKDVGLLSLFFLNLLRLQPGQAIFLAANEIHAYLSGDCIECMACSDNVIRAGLTPKYKDVAQLISCLNYAGLSASHKIFQPHYIDQYAKVFVPPVDDFAVIEVILPSTIKNYKLQVQPYTFILLVLKGKRTLRLRNHSDLKVGKGSIVFIPAEAAPEIEFVNESNDQEVFEAYIATYNYFKS